MEGVGQIMQLRYRFNYYTIMKGLAIAIILFAMLYPLLYMLSISLSSPYHVIRNDISFYPKGINIEMYKFTLKDEKIFTAYKNTLILVILGTAISLSITCAAAYALSKKKRLPGAKFMNIMILVTMFFSGGMIPKYLVVTNVVGLYDTIWAIILPVAVRAYFLIIMRTFFIHFPEEIEESGRMDGLNDLGVLWYLVLPLSTAVLATIGLFYAVGYWNSFMTPFLYLNSQDKYPLQIILRQIVLQGTTDDMEALTGFGMKNIPQDAIKYTTIIVSIIPIIAVYPFLQKYFVKGVMIGSLKG